MKRIKAAWHAWESMAGGFLAAYFPSIFPIFSFICAADSISFFALSII